MRLLLAHAIRSVRRDPLCVAAVVLNLGLGLGISIAAAFLLEALVFRLPSHVLAPERLVVVPGVTNYFEYLRLYKAARSLQIASFTRTESILGRGLDAAPIRLECVTPEYFSVLGTTAMHGRTFAASDLESGDGNSVVLGYGQWQHWFGGDPGAVGQPVRLAGRLYTVVGVLPRGFTGVGLEDVGAWILLRASPETCSFTGRSLLTSTAGAWLTTVGRLENGVSHVHAAAELAALADPSDTGTSGTAPVDRLTIVSLTESRRLQFARSIRSAEWLGGGAIVLLLIACLNVSGLFCVRMIERRGEIAIRLQLGATRTVVFAQTIADHAVWALLSVPPAAVVALWTHAMLRGFFPIDASGDLISLRWFWILGCSAIVAVGLSSILPIVQSIAVSPFPGLPSGQSLVSDRSGFRKLLLILQVGLALGLCVYASLFVRSVQNLGTNVGFDIDPLVVVSLQAPVGQGSVASARDQLERLQGQIEKIPDVESVSATTGPLLGAERSSLRLLIKGAGTESEMAAFNAISPGYFATTGTRLVKGRAFNDQDRANTPTVGIISRGLAGRLWPNQDPLGRCVVAGPEACVTIVGVSESRRHGSLMRSTEELHLPIAQASSITPDSGLPILVVRVRDASQRAASVISAVRSLGPNAAALTVRPLTELAQFQTRSWRLSATMFSFFATAAVGLAAMGIYGSFALATRQRRSEFGLRMALGASRFDVAKLVMGQGVAVVGAGLFIGILGTLVVTRLVATQFFNVASTDEFSMGVAMTIVFVAGVCGCVVPAVRASSVDPAIALRHQ